MPPVHDDPTVQARHADAPSADEYDPAGHTVRMPRMQNENAGHTVHAVWPVLSVYWPGGQTRLELPKPVQKRLAGHSTHETLPANGCEKPDGHDCRKPSTHTDSAGHWMHADAPGALVYEPLGQTVSMPPLQKKPARHGTQTDCPKPGCVCPDGQDVRTPPTQ